MSPSISAKSKSETLKVYSVSSIAAICLSALVGASLTAVKSTVILYADALSLAPSLTLKLNDVKLSPLTFSGGIYFSLPPLRADLNTFLGRSELLMDELLNTRSPSSAPGSVVIFRKSKLSPSGSEKLKSSVEKV